MKKALISALCLVLSTQLFAHVVVRPNQAGLAAFQTFAVSVPNEKDIATVEIRLLIPEGLNYVTPTVKPGWTVRINKSGEGENARISEIVWTGGSIPSGFRDDFGFSAQVPSQTTVLVWKAYQTYQGGVVVSWDREPSGGHDESPSDTGPYSQTKIVDDLVTQSTGAQVQNAGAQASSAGDDILLLVIACAALLLSGIALSVALAKRKN